MLPELKAKIHLLRLFNFNRLEIEHKSLIPGSILRKRWHLFPPEDTSFLYPTRIPYEESSIFSKVNIANPDFKMFPEFIKARPHLVTLHPGQVLFIPRHWWHYVESLDPLTVSINSWIELDVDDEARVGEAITRATVCALKSVENLSSMDSWLNPTEVEATTHDVNLHYLNLAVQACLHKHKGDCSERTLRSDVSNELSFLSTAKKIKFNEDKTSSDTNAQDDDCNVKEHESRKFRIPFGDNLTPVLPRSQRNSLEECETAAHNFKDIPLTQSLPSQCYSKSICHEEHSASVESNEIPCDAPVPSTSTSPLEISTNDLLDCLVHPDVIALVTQLLLKKQSIAS
ncbi:HSPB1-associated protein 1-like [Protopterus annectens]|uniref:HSPB1-associated protein 1-like n=1 Tax=Protopterus annectens TaxID=7888 RepID=UPI001CFA9068|nr:HSPB1-associated protein 1-like [Protopterus annectens]